LSSFMQLELLSRGSFSDAEAQANDLRQQLIGRMGFALYCFTVVIFGCWIVRAQKNVRALGADGLRKTPGWAVGSFFIPITNLWVPYQAMRDLWQASHNPRSWKDAAVDAILPEWWTLWIVSNFLGHLSFRAMTNAQGLEGLQSATYWEIAALIVNILLCWVAYCLVTQIADAQRASAETGNARSTDGPWRIKVYCPGCNRTLRGATSDMIGDLGVCPKCRTEFIIPEPTLEPRSEADRSDQPPDAKNPAAESKSIQSSADEPHSNSDKSSLAEVPSKERRLHVSTKIIFGLFLADVTTRWLAHEYMTSALRNLPELGVVKVSFLGTFVEAVIFWAAAWLVVIVARYLVRFRPASSARRDDSLAYRASIASEHLLPVIADEIVLASTDDAGLDSDEAVETATKKDNPIFDSKGAQSVSGSPDGNRATTSVRLQCVGLLADRLNRESDELPEQQASFFSAGNIAAGIVVIFAITFLYLFENWRDFFSHQSDVEALGSSFQDASSTDLRKTLPSQAPKLDGEATSSTVRLEQKWPRSFGLARKEQETEFDPAANLNADKLIELAATAGHWIGREHLFHRIKEEFPQYGLRIVRAELDLTTKLRPAFENIESIFDHRFTGSDSKLSEIRTSTQAELAAVPLDNARSEAAVLQLEKWATSERGSLPGIQTLLAYHPKYIRNPERELLDGFTQEFRSDGSGKSLGLKPRVIYPISWKSEDGERPHILKKFKSPSSAEMVMLSLHEAPPEMLDMLTTQWEQHEVMAGVAIGFVEGMAENQAIERVEILDSGAIWLAGGLAGWAEYEWSMNRSAIEFDSHGLLISMFRKGRWVTLMMDASSVKTIDPLSAEQKFMRVAPLYQQMLNMFDLFDRYD